MKLPLDNLALKAVSLGLAGLLWYVIAGEKTSERGLTVPVELQNFPRELELTGEPVNAIEVRLRASPGIIQRLGPGDVSARVDLAGVGEGEHIVHLTAESVRVPFGVRVVRISPSTITLHFERTLQKSLPVRPRLVGRPAPGFEVTELVSEPAEVRVTGPKSRVQEVESAFTEPISVEGARAPVSDQVTVGVEDPLLRVLGSPRVIVTAQVGEVAQARTFAGVPLAVRGGAGEVQPREVEVTLAGPAAALQAVAAGDVHPYVDVSALRGPGRAAVAVELAGDHAGVSVKEWHPREVAVRPVRRATRR